MKLKQYVAMVQSMIGDNEGKRIPRDIIVEILNEEIYRIAAETADRKVVDVMLTNDDPQQSFAVSDIVGSMFVVDEVYIDGVKIAPGSRSDLIYWR